MYIEEKNLEKARELLLALKDLEEAIDVLSNYDAKAYGVFETYFNHNEKKLKQVKLEIQLTPEIHDRMIQNLKDQILEIKSKLATM